MYLAQLGEVAKCCRSLYGVRHLLAPYKTSVKFRDFGELIFPRFRRMGTLWYLTFQPLLRQMTTARNK